MQRPTVSLWNLFPMRSAAGKRRTHKGIFGETSEALELRRMLSAVTCDVGEAPAEVSEANTGGGTRRQGKAALDIPDMTGTWNLTSELDGGGTIQTTLILTQKGKKVTGTLQNEGQPPGKIKLKIGKVVDAQGPKDANDPHEVKGKAVNPVLDSPPKTVTLRGVITGGAVFLGIYTSKLGEQLSFEGAKEL